EVLLQQGVDVTDAPADVCDQARGIVGNGPARLPPRLQDGRRIRSRHVRLKEDVECHPPSGAPAPMPSARGGGRARRSPRVHAPYFSRVRYSPVRVSTFTRSPSPTKRGTCTTTPVSSVAGLRAPLARSPFTPGSVWATLSTTEADISTPRAVPSCIATTAVPPSVR